MGLVNFIEISIFEISILKDRDGAAEQITHSATPPFIFLSYFFKALWISSLDRI
jgi:hypothetical protein